MLEDDTHLAGGAGAGSHVPQLGAWPVGERPRAATTGRAAGRTAAATANTARSAAAFVADRW